MCTNILRCFASFVCMKRQLKHACYQSVLSPRLTRCCIIIIIIITTLIIIPMKCVIVTMIDDDDNDNDDYYDFDDDDTDDDDVDDDLSHLTAIQLGFKISAIENLAVLQVVKIIDAVE